MNKKVYKVRVLWINDFPWYMELNKKDIAKYEKNPNVLDILIFD